MIAEIIVNSSANELNRVFDYKVPEGYDVGKNIDIGYRVLVSFAHRKQLEIGYIIGFKESSQYKCKEISRVVDVAFDKTKMEIAKWMANRYFCNLSDVLKLLVPPGTSNNIDKVKSKTERWIRLTESYKESIQQASKENDIEFVNKDDKNQKNSKKLIKNDKQQRIVDFLLENKEIPVAILLDAVDVTAAVLKTLEKNGVVESYQMEVSRNPFVNKLVKRTEPLILTKEQQDVMEQIKIDEFGEYLLHGITGSGKTEIYLQLIDKVIKNGKTAIVLVPEISLTPQITDRFLARFGRIIAILHSKLSQGERYDEWKRIQKGEAKIVVGARSALFAPVQNVGIIIIDEEHDASYKSETTPKYDAREVAEKIAQANNSVLLLGSATPDVRTYYRALHRLNNEIILKSNENSIANTDNNIIENNKRPNIKLLELKNRISKNGLPDIKIVDLREELATGNKTVFSRLLYQEIKKNLENKEQTILFLNRRGYSTFIMCRDCGYVVKCDKCDVAMTYHMTKNKLLCHYCGEEKPNVSICPDCGGNNIRYFGTGTQKIEAEIHKYFPEASVIRMDVDTTSTKNAHEIILNKFKNEKIDILLGTQMITKGHDFENVTLVGVLAADSSINIGDYRANERTYQLLTQVAGRAGRGDKRGRAIIQTYMPDEFSILAAKKQVYEDFYSNEINVREKLNFPPFCDIIIAVIIGTDEKAVIQDAKQFYEIFKDYFEIFKPVPAPISKINDNYRWRVLLKAKVTEDVIKRINYCLDNFEMVRNKDNKLNFDINPNNMM